MQYLPSERNAGMQPGSPLCSGSKNLQLSSANNTSSTRSITYNIQAGDLGIIVRTAFGNSGH